MTHLDPDPRPYDDVDRLAISCIRGIAMDAPQKANSGHSGTAMALAPLAHVLYTRVMRHDPQQPAWPDRDRFVLSCGHASILLYTMLHLTGYSLTVEDLKQFRQLGSRTPGHPEMNHLPGVEVTTGPLGQGLANSAGMAIAERNLRARYGEDVMDHRTFAFASDGDLEEGISHEAASLAGHQGLGRLTVVYDDNHISIDGDTALAYSDNVPERFRAYGWHVDELGEAGEDLEKLESALRAGGGREDQPTLIVLRSHIGYPSPTKTDTSKAHGEPFGAEDIAATKKIMGIPEDQDFYVAPEVTELYSVCGTNGHSWSKSWAERVAGHPLRDEFAAVWDRAYFGEAPELPIWKEGESVATRVAAHKVLNAIAPSLPSLFTGSADLTGNTGTGVDTFTAHTKTDHSGRQMHYGIREHAMGGISNGMAAHGGVRPIGSTFMVFTDYQRPSLRLAALSQMPVIYWYTHDSIGVGEDGPTHQPVEHLASMRAIPDLIVVRPADANETSHAIGAALQYDGPVVLAFSRQNLPILAGTAEAAEGVHKGGYVLEASQSGQPDMVLVGTGSEVQLCVSAAKVLRQEDGLDVSVVSLPSWELFGDQDPGYIASVLPPDSPAVGVEAGVSLGWERFVDDMVCLDRFGASGPASEVIPSLGFTTENVVATARQLLDDLDALEDAEMED